MVMRIELNLMRQVWIGESNSLLGRFTNVTSKLDKVVYSWENEVCVMKTMDGVVQPSDTKPEQEQYFNQVMNHGQFDHSY